jgi:hypothetical protein
MDPIPNEKSLLKKTDFSNAFGLPYHWIFLNIYIFLNWLDDVVNPLSSHEKK